MKWPLFGRKKTVNEAPTANKLIDCTPCEAPNPHPLDSVAFRQELASVLNRYSVENTSDTPDYILADYLVGCLRTFNATVGAKNSWYGCSQAIGKGCISKRVRDKLETDELYRRMQEPMPMTRWKDKARGIRL